MTKAELGLVRSKRSVDLSSVALINASKCHQSKYCLSKLSIPKILLVLSSVARVKSFHIQSAFPFLCAAPCAIGNVRAEATFWAVGLFGHGPKLATGGGGVPC